MKGRMFDPSDTYVNTYPDTYLDTYLDTYPDTYPHNVHFVKSPALRNMPPKHTPIQTCCFDHGLAGNTVYVYLVVSQNRGTPI